MSPSHRCATLCRWRGISDVTAAAMTFHAKNDKSKIEMGKFNWKAIKDLRDNAITKPDGFLMNSLRRRSSYSTSLNGRSSSAQMDWLIGVATSIIKKFKGACWHRWTIYTNSWSDHRWISALTCEVSQNTSISGCRSHSFVSNKDRDLVTFTSNRYAW